MKKRILLINTKAYIQVTGKRLERLTQASGSLSGKAEIIFAVQPSDIPLASRHVTTFAQHVDAIEPGKHTGRILPESVKQAGAKGILINHYERRLPIRDIKANIERARRLGLRSIVCVSRNSLVRQIAPLGPDYIAFEAPELIGTGISVSRVEPEVIRRFVRLVKKANPRVGVLCGAGVSSTEDVSNALELGTDGVLLASAVPKARDPEKKVKELLRGF